MELLSRGFSLQTIAMTFALGLVAGVLSGAFGVGGGVVIVPILVLMLRMPQQSASATSMVALLLPVGILGVVQYYQAGVIHLQHIKIGLLIALGIFIGALGGAKLALKFPEVTMKRAFAIFLFIVAIRMYYATYKNRT